MTLGVKRKKRIIKIVLKKTRVRQRNRISLTKQDDCKRSEVASLPNNSRHSMMKKRVMMKVTANKRSKMSRVKTTHQMQKMVESTKS